jgi:hypothetical protein
MSDSNPPEAAPRVFVDRRAPVPKVTSPWATPGKVIAGILATGGVVAVLSQPVTFLFGGLRPQSQIDVANLQKDNLALAARLDTMTATEASDKALLLAQIEAAKQLFTTRLEAMWRPTEFADRDAHLSRLDAVFEAQRNIVTDHTYDIKDLREKYQALTTVPTPGPARSGR